MSNHSSDRMDDGDLNDEQSNLCTNNIYSCASNP